MGVLLKAISLPGNSTASSPSSVVTPQKSLGAPKSNNGGYHASIQQRPPELAWNGWYNDPLLVFTFVLAVATVVLGVSTTFLWWTTRRSGKDQAEKMERSAVAMEGVAASMAINATQIVRSVDLQKRYGQMQLRPYLVVLVGTGVFQTEQLRFEVNPQVLNTGGTPARNVSWRIELKVVETKDAADFKFPLSAKVGGSNMIAPRADYNLSATLPDRVSEEDATQLFNGGPDKMLIVYGCVSYRDAFKKRYLTTFAQQVFWTIQKDKDGNVTGAPLRGRFLFKHNHAN